MCVTAPGDNGGPVAVCYRVSVCYSTGRQWRASYSVLPCECVLQHRATVEGQLLRSDNQHRPFVLSRAFFAGSQRYGEHDKHVGHLESSFYLFVEVHAISK